ncbi:MAG TPA: RuBisCO large subunit C-terminal-like domain-containing protein [Elusimicrobiota bacterium]|nr:RuBisCO large subunit C-terminal-like domain-containing protein [Elusimicrobiota bacterium]
MHYDPTIFQMYESLEPDRYILAFYYCEQPAADILQRAFAIAIEQSSGTWLPVPEETPEVRGRSAARVVGVYEIPDINTAAHIDAPERRFIAAIAFPADNIKDQFPLLLTTLNGNISMVKNLKLLDVIFPKRFMKHFQGPQFGIPGLRKILNVPERPLLVAMFKPCVGFLPKAAGKMFYEMGVGGVDIVKDDELLGDPDFCPIEARVEECLKAMEKVKRETGRTVLYTVNITDAPDKMLRTAEKVLKMGNNALMIDIFTAGYASFKMVAEQKFVNVPILAHPAMAGIYYASPQWGFSAALSLGKFVRMAGADIMIYPSQYGKVPLVHERAVRVAQEQRAPFYHLKPLFPGPSAGNHQGLVSELIRTYGPDIVIGAGGSIHGHPGGAIAGAKAFIQAMNASLKNIPLRNAAKKHKELRASLEKWGVYGEDKNNYDLTR